ncbi:MAG: ABC transporter ATP-binding protein [Clostridia bacterium]|nr:ABC transporter ATP-binding protein [Clostridia bacterium]
MTQEQPVVKVKDLVQRIGKKEILKGISFEVASGEFYGIFGHGGSGKTTLLHIIAGIERFTGGMVEVLGFNVRKSEKFKKYQGIVTQQPSLFRELRAGENIDFIGALKGVDMKGAADLVERLGLKEHLKERTSALDAGVYKRLSLACALLGPPKLLLLDEPFSGIDLESQRLMLKEVRNFVDGGGTCIGCFSGIEVCAAVSSCGWLKDGTFTPMDPSALREKWEEEVTKLYEKRDGENAESA